MGEHDQRVVDRWEQTFGVKNVMLHEEYHHTLPMNYDIALLELKGHIHFSKFFLFFFIFMFFFTKTPTPYNKL